VPKNCNYAQDLSSGVQTLGDGTRIASLAGSKTKRAKLLARVFQDKLHQCDCAEILCAQDLSSGAQKELHERCAAVGTIFSGQIASMRLCRKTVRPRLVKRCAKGATRKMHSCWHDFFRTNSINAIVPKNCAPKTCQAVRKRSDTKNAQLLARFFQDKFHQSDCTEKLQAIKETHEFMKMKDNGTFFCDN